MDETSRRDVLKLLTALLAGGAVLPEVAEAAAQAATRPSLEEPIRTSIIQREDVRGSVFQTWYLETESIGSNNAKIVSKAFATKTGDVTTIHLSSVGYENASDPVPTFTSETSLNFHQEPLDERHVNLRGHRVLNGEFKAFGPVKAVRQANPLTDPSNDELIENMHRGIARRRKT